MLLMSLSRLRSPAALQFLSKRDFLARRTPVTTFTSPSGFWNSISLRCMSARKPTSPKSLDEPKPKRRKVDIPSPRYIRPFGTGFDTGTMTSQSGPNPTTLELNETETKLRQLLLDVAAYIDDTVGEGSVESAVKVPDQLTKEKIVLRFTGGWVRDKLLGVESHDIDVAINKMTGEHFGLKIIEYLDKPGNAAKYGLEPKAEEKGKGGKSKKIAPGLHKIEANPEKSKNLETATTKILGLDIDLVNLRKETYNEISRNPEIEFGTPEEDAMRRDATINAMFYNLNTQVIEDFTGCGFEDMAAKIIRTPLEPYQTFKDDPLRVLRLIRFASRLNYTIDSETQKAMSNDEIGEVLKIKISRERVGIELEKMLKGPDPLLALQLIDKLGLYNTIFTDPTRDLKSEPDTDYFSPAYAFVNSVVREKASNIPETIGKTLTGNAEEQYLAWICATVMPWADAPTIPHQKPTQRPYYAAYLVAREGFKAPNKVCDVIAAALRDGEEIRKFVDECHSQLRRPNSSKVGDDAAARDTLGMAVRRWGATWRSQVLFSLIYELVLGSVSRESILQSYTTFLDRLISLEILDAYTFKPLITGTELAKALNTKPGPWMKDALDVVMAWQLRNPSITDPAEAVEAVKESKTSKSELSSCLATHFLTLTVRSLFSQDKNPNPTITPAGNKAPVRDTRGPARYPEDTSGAPWKDPKNSSAIDLLKWSIASLDSKAIESNWHLIIPPILKMTDDLDTHWKATGCDLLTTLLTSTPPSLLKRTGLNAVFEDTLFPFFTYLPTLTPEPESIVLLSKVHPALLALANAIHPSDRSQNPPPSSLSTPREKFLDRILRDGFLAPLFHAPPSAYPRLATMLLEQHNTLVQSMGIDAVKHLQALTSLLSTILAEPLGLAYVQLMVAATKSYRVLIQNTWPRIGVYKGEIMRGVGLAWIRCCEDGGRGEGIEKLKGELNEVVEMLDAVFVGDQKGEWEEEKLALVKADEKLGGLLRGV